ncbi:MAG: hypothetical protein ACM3SV_04135 [Betaproteobacteria bacterium]
MENERPGEEPSSSGPDAFSGSLFPLPVGYRLEQYTIQAMVSATADEITYLAVDDTHGDNVTIEEYFPDDVVMRLSDQSVSSILEADEQKLRDGVVRFMERSSKDRPAAPRGRDSKVFEANNTAYRVTAQSHQSLRRAEAGWSPWRYFAIGAGSALALVLLGVGGYLVSSRGNGKPPPSLAAAPAAQVPPTVSSTTSSSMPVAVATTQPPMVTTTVPAAVPNTAPTQVAPPVARGAGMSGGAITTEHHHDSGQHAPARSSARQRPRIDIAGKNGKGEAGRSEAKNPTTFLILDIEPAGRIYVDGKMVGSSPPLTRVPVSPGRHRVEIHGDLPPGIYYYRVNLRPGENQPLTARFERLAY